MKLFSRGLLSCALICSAAFQVHARNSVVRHASWQCNNGQVFTINVGSNKSSFGDTHLNLSGRGIWDDSHNTLFHMGADPNLGADPSKLHYLWISVYQGENLMPTGNYECAPLSGDAFWS